MIKKIIDENSISVIPEESDDLLILRRIIQKDDRVIADTTRVIKQEKEYSRPDRGEKVRIRIALNVEKVSLDNVLDRLRVHGVIIESNNESVPHGSHHSISIKPDEGITIFKKKWNQMEKKLLESKDQNVGFLLIAIDTADCGIGKLKGTHLQIMPNIYSGASGKRYKTNFNIEKFFEEVHSALLSLIKDNDTIIVFGPGETRKKFANYLEKKFSKKKFQIKIVDGIDSGGEDGIYTFTKSPVMKEILSNSKLAIVSTIIDEIMYMANKKSQKFTMGFSETKEAGDIGAIESLIFSDKIIQTENEDKIIQFLNDIESKGAKVFSVDSSTDVGLRVDGLGGIIATLRYSVSKG
ncbi:MAG: mRNA surveillance protein pelota [Crenarchaeota archaeon]|nr:MAG: mRNA surveillance protein pelota [Thermoproteota archaeon]RDJ33365.1 MAG: mRNA surveillance protein pelota [Thermoproteota archaeon]RDJ36131.1 MAG: mRNA surveillance protein pelota [Thermoproteota archaeon]RDJ38763.1 MAG: mRNA surveillance protein pelota [Thermoproteota archaeon]